MVNSGKTTVRSAITQLEKSSFANMILSKGMLSNWMPQEAESSAGSPYISMPPKKSFLGCQFKNPFGRCLTFIQLHPFFDWKWNCLILILSSFISPTTEVQTMHFVSSHPSGMLSGTNKSKGELVPIETFESTGFGATQPCS